MIKKTTVKHSSLKVSFSLNKAYTSIIFSSAKSFIKSITSLLIYYNLFTFSTIMKNKKTASEYYRKKIIADLLKVIYLLTLNTYKATIIDLKSDL